MSVVMVAHFVVSVANLVRLGVGDCIRAQREKAILRAHHKQIAKRKKMKLYNWESWQKKRSVSNVDSNTLGLGSQSTMVRQMKTNRVKKRGRG